MSTASLNPQSVPKLSPSSNFRYSNYYNTDSVSNPKITGPSRLNTEQRMTVMPILFRSTSSSSFNSIHTAVTNTTTSTSTSTTETTAKAISPRQMSTESMFTIEDKFMRKPRSNIRLNGNRRYESMTTLSSGSGKMAQQTIFPQISHCSNASFSKNPSLKSHNGTFYFPNGEIFTPRQQPKNRSSRPQRTQRFSFSNHSSSSSSLSSASSPSSQVLQYEERNMGSKLLHLNQQVSNDANFNPKQSFNHSRLHSLVSMPNLKSSGFVCYTKPSADSGLKFLPLAPPLDSISNADHSISPAAAPSSTPPLGSLTNKTKQFSVSSQQSIHNPTASSISSVSPITNSCSPSSSVEINGYNDTPPSSINCDASSSTSTTTNSSPTQTVGINYFSASSPQQDRMISSCNGPLNSAFELSPPVISNQTQLLDQTLEWSPMELTNSSLNTLDMIEESDAASEKEPNNDDDDDSTVIVSRTEKPAVVESTKQGSYLGDGCEKSCKSSLIANKTPASLITITTETTNPIALQNEDEEMSSKSLVTLTASEKVKSPETASFTGSTEPTRNPSTALSVCTVPLLPSAINKQTQQLKTTPKETEKKSLGLKKVFLKLFGGLSSVSSSTASTSTRSRPSPTVSGQYVRRSAPPLAQRSREPKTTSVIGPELPAIDRVSRLILSSKKSNSDLTNRFSYSQLKKENAAWSLSSKLRSKGNASDLEEQATVPLTVSTVSNPSPIMSRTGNSFNRDSITRIPLTSSNEIKLSLQGDLLTSIKLEEHNSLNVDLSDVGEEEEDVRSFVVGDDIQIKNNFIIKKSNDHPSNSVETSKLSSKLKVPSLLSNPVASHTNDLSDSDSNSNPSDDPNDLKLDEDLDYLSSIIGLGETSFFDDHASVTKQEKISKRESLRIKSLEKKRSLSRSNTINSNANSDTQSINTKVSINGAHSFEFEENDYDIAHYKYYKPRYFGDSNISANIVDEDSSSVIITLDPEKDFEIITNNSIKVPTSQKLMPVKGCLKDRRQYKQINCDPRFTRMSPTSSSTNLSTTTPTSSSPSIDQESAKSNKVLSFSNKVYLNETYSLVEYDRFNIKLKQTYSNLSSSPNLVKEIRNELNNFKRFEMSIHDSSKHYTHFFRD